MNSKTEFEIYQEAFEKINWKEAVAPVVRGVMLVEDSQVEAYNKIQKLLNSTGMESCHQFLLDLDPSELTEAESTKVNNLFRLAQERGFVETEEDEPVDEEEPMDEEDVVFPPAVQPKQQIAKPEPKVSCSAFTVLYSAMRNGQVKTGEAFSNSLDTRSAKADVISKLEHAGYQNINILAIEAGDPDSVGCDNTYCKQSDFNNDIPDYSADIELDINDEAEKVQLLGNTLKPARINASSANSCGNDCVSTTIVTPDEEQEEIEVIDDDEVDENDMLHNRHHNAHVNEEDEDSEDTEDSGDEENKDSEDSDTTDDEDTEDDEETKDDEEGDEETKEEDPEEPDEKLKDEPDSDEEADDDETDDEKELSASEKEQLKDSYKKAFKAALQKCKFKKAFFDLTLEEKIKFFTELEKAWGKKPDPAKFMTDKETEQLEKIVVKN